MKMERRAIGISELRTIRAEGEAPKIRGYAAVFNSMSQDLGGFREKIAPGAFKETIEAADVRALWNHDSNFVLGRNKSGTLALSEDENGLMMEVTPPDTQWARDLMISIDRGDVTQQSFGFRTVSDSWEKKDGEEIRTLEEVELFDVSPVTYPAYPDTSVALRSMDEWRNQNTAPDPAESDDPAAQEDKPEPTPCLNILKQRLSLNEKLLTED